MEELVLIWSFEHNAWWRPNSQGYTYEKDLAGKYPRSVAEKLVAEANVGGKNEEIREIPSDGEQGSAPVETAREPGTEEAPPAVAEDAPAGGEGEETGSPSDESAAESEVQPSGETAVTSDVDTSEAAAPAEV